MKFSVQSDYGTYVVSLFHEMRDWGSVLESKEKWFQFFDEKIQYLEEHPIAPSYYRCYDIKLDIEITNKKDEALIKLRWANYLNE